MTNSSCTATNGGFRVTDGKLAATRAVPNEKKPVGVLKGRPGRDVLEERKGGGSGTQKFVFQKWPDKIFPMVNFVFSRDGHFSREGGGGAGWGGVTPPSSFGVRPF